jgi:hypothetical protein
MYIYLASNATHPAFENTITSFRNELPYEIPCKNSKIALIEAILPLTLSNLDFNYSNIYFLATNINLSSSIDISKFEFRKRQDASKPSNTNYFLVSTQFEQEIEIPLIRRELYKGHYATAGDLLSKFKYSLPLSLKNKIKTYHHRTLNKITIEIPENTYICFPKSETKFGDILGFGRATILGPGINTAIYSPFQSDTIAQVHICVNCIAPQILGEKRLPIIRSVEFQGARDSYLYYRFQNPHYYDIIVDSLKDIAVEIRSPDGEIAVFQTGNVILLCHLQGEAISE